MPSARRNDTSGTVTNPRVPVRMSHSAIILVQGRKDGALEENGSNLAATAEACFYASVCFVVSSSHSGYSPAAIALSGDKKN